MRKTVIICEYNLLHLGHLRQIEAVSAPDNCIVAVMSGNFVQRGEAAVLDKFTRARAAVMSGVDLVLELPYPWSGAGAEQFAAGGVAIAAGIGADSLCFGSESGDADRLKIAAKRIAGGEFDRALANALKSAERNISYAAVRERVYSELFGEKLQTGANDILGIEYLKAIDRMGGIMEPYIIKREGDWSATEARKFYRAGDMAALDGYLAPAMLDVCRNQKPYSLVNADTAILHTLRNLNPACAEGLYELGGGLAGRIIGCAQRASSLCELYRLAATKKYTDARIRRAVLSAVLDTPSDSPKQPPLYTQVLAAGKKGTALLREISKTKGIEILTKPAAGKCLAGEAGRQFEFAYRADMFHTLCAADEDKRTTENILKQTPYIEKQ